VVIGNDLHRRKYEVVFVSRKEKTSESTTVDMNSGDFQEYWLRIAIPDTSGGVSPHKVKEIEEDIVAELGKRHASWISKA
jgi:phosphopantothenate-cysteine ligase